MIGGMAAWLWWLLFVGSLVLGLPLFFLAMSVFEFGWGWWRP